MHRLTPGEREAVLYALRSAVSHQVLPPEKAGALVAGLAKLEDDKSDGVHRIFAAIEATQASEDAFFAQFSGSKPEGV